MRRKAGKHETSVFLNPRNARQAEVLFAKARRAAVGDGHRCQRAIGLETPAVVEAGHAGGMPAAVVDHLGAAMRAAVEQNMYLSAAIARHHHRLTAKFSGEV